MLSSGYACERESNALLRQLHSKLCQIKYFVGMRHCYIAV
jgi:hypothetical protein